MQKELFCAGTDLSLKSLVLWEGNQEIATSPSQPLLDAAINSMSNKLTHTFHYSLLWYNSIGVCMYALNFHFFSTEADLVPLVSILVYVRLALCCDQHEVINLLLERATSLAETSSDPAVGREMVCIRVLQNVDSVRGVARGRKVTLTGGESHPGQYTYTHTHDTYKHTHTNTYPHTQLWCRNQAKC